MVVWEIFAYGKCLIGFGIRNTAAQVTQNLANEWSGIRDPSSTNRESEIRVPLKGNPEFKTVLEYVF